MKKLTALITAIAICLISFPSVFADESITIKAENWMEGGNGVGFYDSETNSMAEKPETNLHGGKTTIRLRDGEWVKYDLPQMETGIYKVTLNAASEAESRVNINIGDTRMIGFAPIASTGSFENYSQVELGNVYIYDGASEICIGNDKYAVGKTNSSFNFESITFTYVSDEVNYRIYANTVVPGGQGVGSYSTRYASGQSDRTPEKCADRNFYDAIVQRAGDWVRYDISYLPEGTYNISVDSAHPRDITMNFVTELDDDIEYAKTVTIPKTAASGYTTFKESEVIDQIFIRDGSQTLMLRGQASAYNLRYINLEYVDSENLTLVEELKINAQNIISTEIGVGFYDNGEHAASVGKWEKNTTAGITSTVFRANEWGKYDISLLKPGKYCATFYAGTTDKCPIELTVDDNPGIEFELPKTGSYTTYGEGRSSFFEVPEGSRHLKVKTGSKIAFVIDITLKLVKEFECLSLDGNLGKTNGKIPRGTDFLSVEFSNEISENGTYKITSSNGAEVSAEYKVNEGKLEICLKEALLPDEDYKLTIVNAEDIYGQKISGESLAFTTTGNEDLQGEGKLNITEYNYSYDDNAFTATGKVVSSKNYPVKNRKIFLDVIDTESQKSRKAEYVSDENGEFECFYELPENSKSGTYEIIISADTTQKSQNYSVVFFDAKGKEALVDEFSNKTAEEIKDVLESRGPVLNIDLKRLAEDIDDLTVLYNRLSNRTYDDFKDLLNTVNSEVYTEYVNSADAVSDVKSIYEENLFRQYLALDVDYLDLLDGSEEEKLIEAITDNKPYDGNAMLYNAIMEKANSLFVERFELNPQIASLDDISVKEGQIGTVEIKFNEKQENINKIELKVEIDDAEFFDDNYITVTPVSGLKTEKESFNGKILTLVLTVEEGSAVEKICSVDITAPSDSVGIYNLAVNGNATYFFDNMGAYAVEPNAFTEKEFSLTVSAKNNKNNRFDGGGSSGGSGGSVNNDFASKPIQDEETPATDKDEVFNDISAYGWAKEAINALAERNIISGKSEGVFAPGDKITRSEFCKMAVLAFDIPFTNVEGKFTDVPVTAWEHDYVMAAYSAGLINGVTETEFDGGSEIKREDMAVIISRYLETEQNAENLLFADGAEISDYAKKAVASLYSLNIINGMDNNMFCPKQSVTRAQAAQVIYNTIMEG